MLANLLRKEAGGAFLTAARGGIPTMMRGRSTLYRGYSKFTGGKQKVPVFRPQYRLNFKDGRFLLASVRMKGYYLFAVSLTCFFGILFIVSLRKLWRFSQRSYFGLFFYGTLGAFTFCGLVSILRHTKAFITKVWLTKSGKTVLMRRGFITNLPREVPIKDIELPEVIPPELAMDSLSNFGYPVIVQGELLWILKETDRPNQEIFSAVFNGHEIDTTEEANEIIIE